MNAEQLARFQAAKRAGEVLHFFERDRPDDDRPRRAIQAAQDFAFGETTTAKLIRAAREAQSATVGVIGPAKHAARAAWSAALTMHPNGSEDMIRLTEEASAAAESSEASRILASRRKRAVTTCAECGKEFEARATAIYCGNTCTQRARRKRSTPAPRL